MAFVPDAESMSQTGADTAELHIPDVQAEDRRHVEDVRVHAPAVARIAARTLFLAGILTS